MITEAELQAVARAIHQALHGKETWNDASKDERSASRHLARVALKAANLEIEAATPQPVPERSASTAGPRRIRSQ
jgi:hypothetical protein